MINQESFYKKKKRKKEKSEIKLLVKVREK